MDSSLARMYRINWHRIFQSVADWGPSEVDAWIAEAAPDLDNEPFEIFHELPSTWVAWTLFPLNDPATTELRKKARNKFIWAAHALHNGKELEANVDWTQLRPVYEKLKSEIELQSKQSPDVVKGARKRGHL